MAVPKKKVSKARRDKRRAHDGLSFANMTECPECGELKRSHHVCMACGYYKGRQVIKVKAA